VHALLVLARAVGRRELDGRQRQQRLALHLADGHVDAGDQPLEVVEHLARHDVGPAVLVLRVGHDRQVHLLAQLEQLAEHV
tara:strand:+ start:1649 stop:1891 length:243 start_codon:yes stop_codon:yes gene_type:complete